MEADDLLSIPSRFQVWSWRSTDALVQTTKHDTAKHENVTDVESVAVYNEEKEELTIFAVNRTLEDDIELTTDLRGMEGFHLVEHIVMEESDLKLVNSSYEEKVVPKTVNRSKMDGGIMTTLLGKLILECNQIK